MTKVFLCHASATEDNVAVEKLYDYLVSQGFEPWLDIRDLLPGQRWDEEIQIVLSRSDYVVICLSNQSVNKEGYVQKEIRIALDKALTMPEGRIFLIPARLEDCNVPNRLKEYQWVDLFASGGHERLIRALTKSAQKYVSPPPPTVSQPPALKYTPPAPSVYSQPAQPQDEVYANLTRSALSGTYTVRGELGRGAHSAVYLVTDRYQNTTAALKAFDRFITADPLRAVNRMKNTQVTASVQHSNLINIHLEDNHSPVFAMEYISGGNLMNWWEGGQRSISGFITLLEQVTAALDFLHGHVDGDGNQILHLNLKPENILVDLEPGGKAARVVLTDLGMYSDFRDTPLNSLYVSPEQVQYTDRKQWTAAADQYSLAAIVYESLTGKPPFPGEEAATVAARRLQVSPALPTQVKPLLPRELDEPIMKALSRTPSLRYASCGEFVKALRKAHRAFMQKEVRHHLSKAQEWIKVGMLDNARAAIQEALFYEPNNPEAPQLLRQVETKEQRHTEYDDAMREWQRAKNAAERILQFSPDYPDRRRVFERLAMPQPGLLSRAKVLGWQVVVGMLLSLPVIMLLVYWILVWVARG